MKIEGYAATAGHRDKTMSKEKNKQILLMGGTAELSSPAFTFASDDGPISMQSLRLSNGRSTKIEWVNDCTDEEAAMASKALKTILRHLQTRADDMNEIGEEEDSEVIDGFIAALKGERITSRGFDDTSHHWKAGWHAAKGS